MVFFRGAGSGLVATDFLAECSALDSVTLLVGSVEPLPVAFFPPVVFAIANSVLAGSWVMKPGKKQKQTAENLLL
jgi:hypothetical protein